MKNKIILGHGYSLGCLKSVLMIVFLFLVLSASLFAQSDSTSVKMLDSMIVQKQQLEQNYTQQFQQLEGEQLVLKKEIESRNERLQQIRDTKNQLTGASIIVREDIKALTERKNKLLKKD